jgi:DNA-binding transcriptional LysR family regulator
VREAFVGHVEAAAIPSMLMGFAPRALQRLSRTHPGLTVHVQERPSHEIETEVESGRCELGLGILSRLSINLAYETLATGPLCAVVPSGHLLRSATSLAPGDLALERVVLHPQGYDMRHIADAWFAREGQRAKVACELSTIESLLAVVRGACMPTLLPRIALEGRDAADLALVPLEGADPIEFGLILPRGSPLAPAADALLSALRDASANHEGRGST